MVSIEVDPRDGVDGGGSSWMDVVGVTCVVGVPKGVGA